MLAKRVTAVALLGCLSIGGIRTAHAVEPRAHLEIAGAHFLSAGGAWQGSEIGLGGVAAGALELGLTRRFGLEARLFAARFVQGDAPSDPSFK
ncbi:MAG: hypothetical protein ABI175_15550, partial [Polyangiales bacterium]